jgi:hypothetical protein
VTVIELARLRRFTQVADLSLSGDYATKLVGSCGIDRGPDRKAPQLDNFSHVKCVNRPHELLHIRAAFHNGVTRDELREMFMQVAVYCGLPAEFDSF